MSPAIFQNDSIAIIVTHKCNGILYAIINIEIAADTKLDGKKDRRGLEVEITKSTLLMSCYLNVHKVYCTFRTENG